MNSCQDYKCFRPPQTTVDWQEHRKFHFFYLYLESFSPPERIMEHNSLPVSHSALANVLQQMGISDISHSTIRQSGSIARVLEKETGTEFLHLEMGIPGLPPASVGVEAEKAALDAGVASIYPNMMGTPDLKAQASRFIKAFLDVDHPGECCIPTVGSMQGSFTEIGRAHV